MNRREALKNTSLLLGFTMSATAVSAVMSGCVNVATVSEEETDPWEPRFLTQDEVKLVAELAETIFPRTQTPGAKDVQVERFIDLMLKDHYQLPEQMEFRRGLETVGQRSQERYDKTFMSMTPEEQHELLSQMDAEAISIMKAGQYQLAERPFFAILKELTYLGYFTSEIIGEQYLAYDPVPGSYDGCIPYTDVGRSWSI